VKLLGIGWYGLTPDEKILILRNVGSEDLYAFDLDNRWDFGSLRPTSKTAFLFLTSLSVNGVLLRLTLSSQRRDYFARESQLTGSA